MNFVFKVIIFLFVNLAMAQSSVSSYNEQKKALETEKASLENDIKKINVQITQTDSLIKAEQKFSSEQKSRQDTDLKRRTSEIEELKQKLNELSSEMAKERNQIAASQIQIENVQATRKVLNLKLASHCRNLEGFIKTSIPWDTELRLERVSALCADLENENATTEEGFSRLRAVYTEEIRFGDEIQISNRTITRKNGEIINASVLRIGNQWIVYQDDNALLYGVLNRKINENNVYEYTWKEDLSFEERQAVKNAIDIKLSRKPPQMITLPLSLSIAK